MKLLAAILAAAPLIAQQTMLLWPGLKTDPAAPPESVVQRGTGGVDDRAVAGVSQPSLTVYLPPAEKATGTAVVISPGGGYARLAIDKEGHDVARWLSSIGVAGLVLKYRLPGSMKGTLDSLEEARRTARLTIEDAQQAVRMARSNAAGWRIKPDSIGLMGFSAGGHLAAMVAMEAPADARPDFLALIYPALPKELDVTAATPPAFLVHAADDRLKAGDNSLRYYLASEKAGVPAEMHVFVNGGHGFGIQKSGKTAAGWPKLFEAWPQPLTGSEIAPPQ